MRESNAHNDSVYAIRNIHVNVHFKIQLQEIVNYIFEELVQLNQNRAVNLEISLFGAFWHCASEMGNEKLSTFVLKYLKITTSAQLERLFSNWAYIYSDIRNRLSADTSKIGECVLYFKIC